MAGAAREQPEKSTGGGFVAGLDAAIVRGARAALHWVTDPFDRAYDRDGGFARRADVVLRVLMMAVCALALAWSKLPSARTFDRSGPVASLLHVALLALLFVGAILAFGFADGARAAIWVLLGYVVWSNYVALRPRADWYPFDGFLIVPAFSVMQLGLAFAVVNLLATAAAEYDTRLAFFPHVSASFDGRWVDSKLFAGLVMLAFMLVLVAWGRARRELFQMRDREGAFRPGLLLRAWARLAQILFDAVLAALPAGVAVWALALAAEIGPGTQEIAAIINHAAGGSLPLLLTEIPAFLLLLIAAAAVPIAFRGLSRGRVATLPAALSLAGLGLVIHAAALAGAGIHARGFIFVDTAVFFTETSTALDDWIESSTEDGVPAAAMAARLQANGHWSGRSDGPDLPELLPELRGKLVWSDDLTCTVDIAAGTLSEAERAAAATVVRPRDVDDEAVQSGGAETGAPRGEPTMAPIKYCLRTSCTKHRSADAGSATWLYSSHRSARDGWREGLAVDLLFGRITGPGGFCTAAGGLAEGFQG